MNNELLSFCVEYIKNRTVIKTVLKSENSHMHPICSLLFLNGRKTADAEAIRNCRSLLKERVGVFSGFRGTSLALTVSMLASDKDPEKRLENSINAYTSLRKHFSSCDYLPLAAMMMSGMCEPSTFDETATRTREIYKLMKKEHPLLTSGEDIAYALLFALSEERNGDSVIKMERCYKILKANFASADSVQSLSHVLALCDGNDEEKCHKVISLFESLRASKLKYGTSYELAILGVLAMLPDKNEDIVADMIEVNEFLMTQKGYGKFFGFGRNIRLMHAAMIVSAYRLASRETAVVSETAAAVAAHIAVAAQHTAIIAAQSAALCATIAATNAR